MMEKFKAFALNEHGRISNQLLSILSALAYMPAANLIADGYVMAFMLNLGLKASDVAMQGFAFTASALLAYFLFSIFRPKNGQYRRTLITNAFGMVIYPACLLIAAFFSGKAALALILAGSVTYSITGAFKSSADFSVIPYLYPRREYGKIAGFGSTMGCIISVAISFIGSTALSSVEGNTGYMVFFAMSAAFMLLSAIIITQYKFRKQQDAPVENKAGGVSVKQLLVRLKDKEFAFRMLPHLLRGASMAGVYYLPLVGMMKTPLNAAQSGYLIVVGVIAQLLGSILFTRLSQRVRSGYLVIIPFAITVSTMLIMPFVSGVAAFFGLYFVAKAATCISDNGIPLGVLKSTSVEDLPLVSSLRMMCTSGINCLLVMVFGLMIDKQPFVAMAIAACVSMVAGVLYFAQFKDNLEDC